MCQKASEATLPYRFAIVGVQKAATSTLASLLGRHPQVAIAPGKEAHFFDDERRDWDRPDYRDYVCPRVEGRVTAGDATPAYLFWPRALERMQRYDPGMRLIAAFRDPVERAFSHWAMQRGRSRGHPDFHHDVQRARPESWPRELPRGSTALFRRRSLVARGFYGAQLRRGLELFDREQWLLLDYHRMFDDLPRTLRAMTSLLEVPPFGQTPVSTTEMAGPTDLDGGWPTAEDVQGLAELYDADLAEFSVLSGLDVAAWPTAQILSGALDPGAFANRLASRVTAGLT